MRSKIGVTDWDFEIEGTVPGPKTETLPIHAPYSCPGVVSRQQSQYIKKISYRSLRCDGPQSKGRIYSARHGNLRLSPRATPRDDVTDIFRPGKAASASPSPQYVESYFRYLPPSLIFFQDEFLSCSSGQSTPPDGKAIHNKDHGACDNRSHNKP